MVKHTQTIHRLLPMNCWSVFDHFVELALKRLTNTCERYSTEKSKNRRKVKKGISPCSRFNTFVMLSNRWI